VNGLRTVVCYKPATDNSYVVELAEMDIREDFPILPPPAKTKQSSSEKAK